MGNGLLLERLQRLLRLGESRVRDRRLGLENPRQLGHLALLQLSRAGQELRQPLIECVRRPSWRVADQRYAHEVAVVGQDGREVRDQQL